MSSPSKPKPPDRGAPLHKPSRKVALDEVLRSLQDLVQNELNVESPPPVESEPPPPTPPPGAADARTTRAEVAATVPPEAGLVESPAAIEAPGIEAAGHDIPHTPTPSAPATTPPEGFQPELPYLDTALLPARDAVAASAPKPLPETEPQGPAYPPPDAAPAAPPSAAADAQALPGLGESPLLPVDALGVTGAELDQPPPPPHAPPIDAGEIPTLEDAVEFPETAPALDVALPAAGDARRLAIQVAARLNVRLRKEGKPVLSTEIITRLAHELETALANGPTNVENSGPEKP
jgi:hypothetical protein